MGLAGAMVNVNWRRERWSAFGDWTYANVRSDSPSRVPALYESIESQVKGHVVQAYVGYDLRPRADSHVDVFGGARYYNLDISIDFSSAVLPGAALRASEDWVDAIGGIRWTQEFAGGWRYLHIDYGNGTSQLDAALTGPFVGAAWAF